MWRKLWPECVNDLKGFKDVFLVMKKVILGLPNNAGFDEVEKADIKQLLQSHGERTTATIEDLKQREMMRKKIN